MAALQMTPTTGVVVTGGASGIGRACATALAEVGRPVAIWDVNADAAATVAKQLASDFDVATFALGIDVTQTPLLGDAASQSRAAIGLIGALVHAAGVVRTQNVGTLDEQSWDFVLDVNLRAEVLIAQALLDDFRRAKPGSAIVGISSIEGVVGHGAIPAYCASKSGLIGLTRSMADQLGPEGIRVNAVCPGYIETPMLLGTLQSEAQRERYITQSTLKRIGQPEDIARAVRFLLSDEAAFVTGTHLVVDGGVTAVR